MQSLLGPPEEPEEKKIGRDFKYKKYGENFVSKQVVWNSSCKSNIWILLSCSIALTSCGKQSLSQAFVWTFFAIAVQVCPILLGSWNRLWSSQSCCDHARADLIFILYMYTYSRFNFYIITVYVISEMWGDDHPNVATKCGNQENRCAMTAQRCPTKCKILK